MDKETATKDVEPKTKDVEPKSTDDRSVEEEPAEFEVLDTGIHANPNGGDAIAHGDEATGPEAFGIAGENPSDGVTDEEVKSTIKEGVAEGDTSKNKSASTSESSKSK